MDLAFFSPYYPIKPCHPRHNTSHSSYFSHIVHTNVGVVLCADPARTLLPSYPMYWSHLALILMPCANPRSRVGERKASASAPVTPRHALPPPPQSPPL